MRIIKNRLSAILIIVVAVSWMNLNSQERNDVIKVYNEGAKAAQTDVRAAIKSFEEVIVLSDKVGESVNDLKQKAMQVLPGLYVRVASNTLNEKKPAVEVIKAAKTAAAVADKYGSKTSKENAGKILVQGYYIMGTEYFTAKDYDNS
ncbi:MAG: hypothetical protein HPY62_01705, partial [Bacteroidales bacterium]|nr:hypothetical protein [Bacteroidales bacterium]